MIEFSAVDGDGAAKHVPELTDLYSEVYGAPPYGWGEEHTELFAQRFEVQRQQDGFALIEARETGRLVGIGFGVTLRPGTPWWQNLIMPVSEEITREYPNRTFAVVELLVRAPWRRRHVAERIHDRLLGNRVEERATLTVLPVAEAAQAAYRKWGWEKVTQKRNPLPGSPLFDVMVKPLSSGVKLSETDQAAELAAFGYELGVLKRIRRAGWWHAGVRDPESVAEHSMRVAQLAAILAAEEGADSARASFLALWHDTQETRTGDLPHTVSGYLTKPDPRQITADQTARLPASSRDVIRAAVDEYEAQQTPESLCAKDADKLEMLLQAVEYRDVGIGRVDSWIDSARRSIKTETGRKVAAAALTLSPLAWRDR